MNLSDEYDWWWWDDDWCDSERMMNIWVDEEDCSMKMEMVDVDGYI